MSARGIDLEIIEKVPRTDRFDRIITVPNTVLINGAEVLVPEGSTIEISPIDSNSVVTATITMMVRSLRIDSER